MCFQPVDGNYGDGLCTNTAGRCENAAGGGEDPWPHDKR